MLIYQNTQNRLFLLVAQLFSRFQLRIISFHLFSLIILIVLNSLLYNHVNPSITITRPNCPVTLLLRSFIRNHIRDKFVGAIDPNDSSQLKISRMQKSSFIPPQHTIWHAYNLHHHVILLTRQATHMNKNWTLKNFGQRIKQKLYRRRWLLRMQF